MKKILILGGTRFFGKQLVQRLLANEDQVTIATRGIKKDLFGSKVSRLFIDRSDALTLRRAFFNREWDIVFDQSCYTPKEALEAALAIKGKADRYIFTSSQSVYNFGTGRKEEDFDPFTFAFRYKKKHEYRGFTGYQEGKRASEKVFFSFDGMKVAAIRFPIVIGKGDHTKRLENHVRDVLFQKPIGIKDKQKRYSFILAEEAADFSERIGKSSFTGVINPGCKQDLSLGELIEKIEKRTAKRVHLAERVTADNQSSYELDGSCSISTAKANQLGFTFSSIDTCFDPLIDHYAKMYKD